MTNLHAVCVARHRYIAEHFARFFADVGIDSVACVGLHGATESARERRPDVVVCEYELLVTLPLDTWECDDVLRYTPIVAVSLTRRSDELDPLDANGIAGFLYLPLLSRDDAYKLLHAASARPRYTPGAAASPQGPASKSPADVL